MKTPHHRICLLLLPLFTVRLSSLAEVVNALLVACKSRTMGGGRKEGREHGIYQLVSSPPLGIQARKAILPLLAYCGGTEEGSPAEDGRGKGGGEQGKNDVS